MNNRPVFAPTGAPTRQPSRRTMRQAKAGREDEFMVRHDENGKQLRSKNKNRHPRPKPSVPIRKSESSTKA